MKLSDHIHLFTKKAVHQLHRFARATRFLFFVPYTLFFKVLFKIKLSTDV